MSELIDRYLDGDLSEDEAGAFLEAVRRDPELEAELRTYEQMLSVSDAGDPAGPSARFTDEVMNRVAAASYRTERHGRDGLWNQWFPRLAWAAGLAVFFGLGQITARSGSDEQPADRSPGRETAQVGMPVAGEVMPSTFRVVRLIYVPEEQDVQNVAVAGTFNGWNPGLTPMKKTGNVWIVQLVLPPDTHEYMFVVNGETWVTDPLAQEVRDDGFGRENAVLDLRI